MRAKRSKQYRKLMHQYELAFNFRVPYQVLVDAEIIKAAARYKMRLGQMLENTLHGNIKPMITQCCIRHLYDDETGDKDTKEGWIAVAKQAERRRCGHHELDEPLSALECILSVVDPKDSGTNKHRYVVATQEMDVRRRLRGVAGVPLIYINRSVMILEPMGEKTEDVRERGEKSKIRAGLKGRPESAGAKRKRGGDDDDDDDNKDDSDSERSKKARRENGEEKQKQRKARGPKGPNPLSVKKTKKDKPKTPKGTAQPTEPAEKGRAGIPPPPRDQDSNAADPTLVAPATGADNGIPSKRRRKRKQKPEESDTANEAKNQNGLDS